MSKGASRRRIAILISGRGSNMAALIEAAHAKDYPGDIALVVSNKPNAPGIEIARAAGINTLVVDQAPFPRTDAGRKDYDTALHEALAHEGIEFICLAGFMRIFSPSFVRRWQGMIVNIHPSLLPAFRGLKPQAQALAAGVTVSGCTVHHVVAELDAGPTIAQAEVPVLPGDTEETLSARILAAEHKLYPQALRQVLEALN